MRKLQINPSIKSDDLSKEERKAIAEAIADPDGILAASLLMTGLLVDVELKPFPENKNLKVETSRAIDGSIGGLVTIGGVPYQGATILLDPNYGYGYSISRANGAYSLFMPPGTFNFTIYLEGGYPSSPYETKYNITINEGVRTTVNWTY